jgi:hypothetical protein
LWLKVALATVMFMAPSSTSDTLERNNADVTCFFLWSALYVAWKVKGALWKC